MNPGGTHMLTKTVVINNPTGLHLRPAGNLCKEAVKYKSRITFNYFPTNSLGVRPVTRLKRRVKW